MSFGRLYLRGDAANAAEESHAGAAAVFEGASETAHGLVKGVMGAKTTALESPASSSKAPNMAIQGPDKEKEAEGEKTEGEGEAPAEPAAAGGTANPKGWQSGPSGGALPSTASWAKSDARARVDAHLKAHHDATDPITSTVHGIENEQMSQTLSETANQKPAGWSSANESGMYNRGWAPPGGNSASDYPASDSRSRVDAHLKSRGDALQGGAWDTLNQGIASGKIAVSGGKGPLTVRDQSKNAIADHMKMHGSLGRPIG